MPLTGEVLEFNPALDESDGDNPGLINSDPYGEGWIIKISISNEEEVAKLLTSEGYQEAIS